jgi:hypothetical protein
MSSTIEQKEQGQQHRASTSRDSNVSTNIPVEPPSSSQIKDEYHALASQTANLDLEDQDTDSILSTKDDKDTWSDEDAPPETVDENFEPQREHATATVSSDAAQEDQSNSTEDVKDADDATTPKDANDEDDETNTPRFETYVKLHNDVSFS